MATRKNAKANAEGAAEKVAPTDAAPTDAAPADAAPADAAPTDAAPADAAPTDAAPADTAPADADSADAAAINGMQGFGVFDELHQPDIGLIWDGADAGATDAEPGAIARMIVVVGPKAGRRRAGRQFGKEPVRIAVDELDDEAFAAIISDAKLTFYFEGEEAAA